MHEREERVFTEKEKEELREAVKEAKAAYKLIQDEKLTGDWSGDSERFMALTYMHTKSLVAHSITLTKLTRGLIGLTIGLVIVSLVNIFLILSFPTNP